LKKGPTGKKRKGMENGFQGLGKTTEATDKKTVDVWGGERSTSKKRHPVHVKER